MLSEKQTAIVKTLKRNSHITVGNFVKIMGTDTVVGVNIHASSLIRKQGFTRPLIKRYCTKFGLTFMDANPNTHAMQILF
jgi:hypothetical protein